MGTHDRTWREGPRKAFGLLIFLAHDEIRGVLMSEFTTGGNDGGGGSIWWLMIKAMLIVVAAYLVFGIVLSLVKYAVVLAILGGAGYLGYKLLFGNNTETKALPPAESHKLLNTDLDDDDAFKRRLRELEAEDKRINDEIDRLLSE